MRTLLFAMLALLTLAPLAAAQETNETKDESDGTRPDDAAWTEDCPPDMMCAYSGGEDEPQPYGNESCIECSGPAPEDGGEGSSEGGAEPGQALGPEDCIDCMRPPQDGEQPVDDGSNGSTCMDGQQEGETCRDDVQYLDGRGPADCEYCRGDDATADDEASPISAPAPGAEGDGGITSVQDEDAKNAVPAAGLGVIVAAFGLAVVLVARKL